MTLDFQKYRLMQQMTTCSQILKHLLQRLDDIENDTATLPEIKLAEIKKIREEIAKVGQEIDTIKKEITLLNSYRVN